MGGERVVPRVRTAMRALAVVAVLAAASRCSSGPAAAPGSGDGGGPDATASPPDAGLDGGPAAGDGAAGESGPGDGGAVDGDAAGSDGGAEAGLPDGAAGDGGDADAAVYCPPPSGSPTVVTGPIDSDTTFTCDQVYAFLGTVLVEPPATLTIQQGTTIRMGSRASLVVGPGARLVARGTRDQPIVFTSGEVSPAAGDWGSIALVGRAPGNWGLDLYGDVITQSYPQANDWPSQFPFLAGGTAYGDSSGALRYVRMEYGGCLARDAQGNCSDTHETLGLYGVGAGTLLDSIDIRQAAFGCLFAEGGTFAASHLVCQMHGPSGGFDFTRGNQSRVQFLVDQETPGATGAEGIGVKGPGDDNQLEPLTSPTVYNATLCGTGPGASNAHGVSLVREPGGLLYDLVVSEFYDGIAMTGGVPTPTGTGLASTQVRSAILYGNYRANVGFGAPQNDTDVPAWYANPDWRNLTTDPGLGSCLDATALRAQPAAALTANAAPPPADGFFDPSAEFVGAFRDTNDAGQGWASGAWIVWSAR